LNFEPAIATLAAIQNGKASSHESGVYREERRA
jgi:hypothetical protein